MNYRWSLGTLIGLPVLIILFAFLIWLGIWLLRKSKRVLSSSDERPVWWCGIASFICAGLLFLMTLIGMWPYSAEYHQWQETTGVVQKIDSRLLASGDGGGTTQRFVVTFTDGRQRSCDDTRCSQVEEQDELTLFCKRAYQWTGTHGYDCTYGSNRSPRND